MVLDKKKAKSIGNKLVIIIAAVAGIGLLCYVAFVLTGLVVWKFTSLALFVALGIVIILALAKGKVSPRVRTFPETKDKSDTK